MFSILINKHLNAGIQSDHVFFNDVMLFRRYIICSQKQKQKEMC